MRKFKLVREEGYPGMSKGKVYRENESPGTGKATVKQMVENSPYGWEEVFDTITPATESEKSKFVISYISRDGLIILNNIIDADNFQEAIDIIKGDEGVRAILSCYKS